MKLMPELNCGLPKLAWVATVEMRKQQARVYHGPWVEVLPEAFIEGLWDGHYPEAGFDQSCCVFGTGAVARDQCITFVSSTSTTDFLYWRASDDRNCVSVANSLPLLLASLDDRLDPHFEEYDLINNSVMSGIELYATAIPTKHGTVNRLMHRNLSVGRGSVLEQDKPLPPQFATFAEYSAYLSASYGRLERNARDSNRQRPMAIFSTQSRGYDTTAANAVAKAHGIDKVFTVTKGKAKGYFADEDRRIETDDDGSDICGVFGLVAIKIDRRALEHDQRLEHLFYASMHENGDFNLQQISAHVVQPTALITGCLGEMWYTKSYHGEHPGIINDALMRLDLGNHGLTEVRLEGGYVQLAFPYIGARSRESIFRITESAEMDPWRLGTSYDRPIPRRLAEQAGIPRPMFGQTKMASVLEYPAPIVPKGRHLRSEFRRFLVDNLILSRLQCTLLPLVRRWNAIVGTTSPHRHVWSYYLQRAASRLLRRKYAFPFIWRHLNGAIFCFCVNRRIGDYCAALRDHGSSHGA